MRACGYFVALLALAVLAGGCASRRQCSPACCPAAPLALDCQPVARQPLAADVSLVSARELQGRSYCNLPEKDAQCLAAANSTNARLLEQEAEALAAQQSGQHAGRTQAQQQILRLQADHERNRAAGGALQLLLRIAEAEAGADNLRRRLDAVASTLDDVRRLQAAGLAAPLTPPEVEAQRLDLQIRLVELELTVDQLNQQLASLLGGDLPVGARFWPDISLKVDPEMPPLEEAQLTALAQRADLAALRLAAQTNGRDNLAAARALLGQSHGGLGLTAGGAKLLAFLHPHATGDEADARQSQLETAVADQERAIRGDVAQTLAAIEARLMQIELAVRRIGFLEQHRDALQRMTVAGAANGFEIRKAAVELLAAQQDLFHHVIEWKLATVRLRDAQGELAIECGYLEVFEQRCW